MYSNRVRPEMLHVNFYNRKDIVFYIIFYMKNTQYIFRFSENTVHRNTTYDKHDKLHQCYLLLGVPQPQIFSRRFPVVLSLVHLQLDPVTDCTQLSWWHKSSLICTVHTMQAQLHVGCISTTYDHSLDLVFCLALKITVLVDLYDISLHHII